MTTLHLAGKLRTRLTAVRSSQARDFTRIQVLADAVTAIKNNACDLYRTSRKRAAAYDAAVTKFLDGKLLTVPGKIITDCPPVQEEDPDFIFGNLWEDIEGFSTQLTFIAATKPVAVGTIQYVTFPDEHDSGLYRCVGSGPPTVDLLSAANDQSEYAQTTECYCKYVVSSKFPADDTDDDDNDDDDDGDDDDDDDDDDTDNTSSSEEGSYVGVAGDN